MMGLEEEQYASQAEQQEEIMPGTDTHDPLTYDPTQGKGTDAWQRTVQMQRELNQRLGLETNAQFRRN